MRNAAAVLRLAQDDPEAATVALAPVLDGSAPASNGPSWVVQAFLLEAIARDALGDAGAAGRALERALDLAEPEGVLMSVPAASRAGPARAPRRAGHRARRPDRRDPRRAGREPEPAPREPGRGRLLEPLSHSEIRVLRYLPTNLSAPEIAGQLYLSANTVKTHMRHLYDKLGAHRRAEAVEQARALGLLAPSARRAEREINNRPDRALAAHPDRLYARSHSST